MSRSSHDVPFDDGKVVRIESSGKKMRLIVLDSHFNEVVEVETVDTGDLTKLARRLNSVAEFVEEEEE